MVKFVQRLMLIGILTVLYVGPASAIPVSFRLESVTIEGAAFPATQTYVPPLPIIGSGTLFEPGATLTLPDYSIIIDVSIDGVLDAQLDITGWTQTITNINIFGGITSTGGGLTTCTDLGGLGAFVCAVAGGPVAGWPPAVGSAKINTAAKTITVIDSSDPNAGTITQNYRYIVPEPGTALLLCGGLVGMGMVRRRERA